MTTPWPTCLCKKHVAIRGLKVSSLEDFELGYESSCKNLIQWIISMKYVVLAAKIVIFASLKTPQSRGRKFEISKTCLKCSDIVPYDIGHEICTNNAIKAAQNTKICDFGHFPIFSNIKYY